MSVFLKRRLNQDVTWWQKSGVDVNGEPTFNSPALIAGRWAENREVVRNAENREVVSEAQALVDRDMKPGDYLAQGDHSGTSNPRDVDGAREIITMQKSETVGPGTNYVRQVAL